MTDSVESALEALRRQQTVRGLLETACRELTEGLDASACMISRVVGDLLVSLVEFSRSDRAPGIGHEYLIPDYPLTQEVITSGEPRAVSLKDEAPDEDEAALLRELVTVVAPYRASTQGSLRLWRKAGACWVAVAGPWSAWLGQRGTSTHKREADRTTPAGAFGFLPTTYGLAPDPGVRYRYHRIVCGDWWVEDSRSPWYNRFKHVRCGSSPPFRVTSAMSQCRMPQASGRYAAGSMLKIIPGSSTSSDRG